MLWLTPHVASAGYRNINQRGIIRKRVDAFSFLNGIYIYFLHSLGILSGLFHGLTSRVLTVSKCHDYFAKTLEG